jgi:hypothetical protein
MAYDSARHVTVLFGGSDYAGRVLGDTWEWNGMTWTERATTGPLARRGATMAYDTARSVSVLYGGENINSGGSYTYLDDTWEWNGLTWTLRYQGSPPKRVWAALAYDSARKVSVLYGSSGYADTWEWDGASWMVRTSGSPAERESHAMVYDIARGKTVLFGGYSGSTYSNLDDTWVWDGGGAAAWTNYGAGWPGTSGVPNLTAASNPVLCAPITVDLGNSLSASTLAGLFIGLAPTDQPTSYDGHLLVTPSNILLFALPGAGLALPGTVPCNPALCGRSIYLQALEVDPGASQGVSFTQGLRLVIGS